MKSDEVFLRHILDETEFVLRSTKGLDSARFAEDEVLRRACARSLEIIGEAVKNLSPAFRKRHKDIEWKKIAGLRDRLIHHYFDVDLDVLWDVVTQKLPDLREQVESMLGKDEK